MEKPFECDGCGGRWKNKSGLKYHKKEARTPCIPKVKFPKASVLVPDEHEHDSSSDFEAHVNKLTRKVKKIKKYTKTPKANYKGKQKAHRKTKHATVHDDHGDEDELGVEHHMKVGRLVPESSANVKILAEILKRAAEQMSTARNSADLEEWLGSADGKLWRIIENSCLTIERTLRARRSEMPGRNFKHALNLYGQHYFYRESNGNIQVLNTVAHFSSSVSASGKTLGLIYIKGTNDILRYGVSGTTSCLKGDSLALDNEEWAPLSFNFGKSKYFKSKGNGWESNRGRETGTETASHVERMLMLDFACMMHTQHWKHDKPREEQLATLHDLHAMSPKVTAVIEMGRAPCDNCLENCVTIQNNSGITFEFIRNPTLGKLKLSKDAQKQKRHPIKSPVDFQPEDGEECEDSMDEDEVLTVSGTPHPTKKGRWKLLKVFRNKFDHQLRHRDVRSLPEEASKHESKHCKKADATQPNGHHEDSNVHTQKAASQQKYGSHFEESPTSLVETTSSKKKHGRPVVEIPLSAPERPKHVKDQQAKHHLSHRLEILPHQDKAVSVTTTIRTIQKSTEFLNLNRFRHQPEPDDGDSASIDEEYVENTTNRRTQPKTYKTLTAPKTTVFKHYRDELADPFPASLHAMAEQKKKEHKEQSKRAREASHRLENPEEWRPRIYKRQRRV